MGKLLLPVLVLVLLLLGNWRRGIGDSLRSEDWIGQCPSAKGCLDG